MTLSDQLLSFIRTNLLRDEGAQLTPDDSLLDRGLIDSIGLIQIMAFLDTQAGVQIPDHAVTPDNFETVRAIVALVEQVRSGG
jgi:acyl carrier protein